MNGARVRNTKSQRQQERNREDKGISPSQGKALMFPSAKTHTDQHLLRRCETLGQLKVREPLYHPQSCMLACIGSNFQACVHLYKYLEDFTWEKN